MSNEINLKKKVQDEMNNSFLSVFSDEYIKSIVAEYNKILRYNFNTIELNRISNDLIKDLKDNNNA